MAFMASKTDQIKINGTVYDIDLPVDATPSISNLYAAVSIGTPNVYTNYIQSSTGSLTMYAAGDMNIVGVNTGIVGYSTVGIYAFGGSILLQTHPSCGYAVLQANSISLNSACLFSFPSKDGTFALIGDVSGTYENDNWLTLTIDGTTKNIPAGGGGGIPLSGTTNLSGNIIPKTSNSYTLGNATYYFSSVYTSQVYANYIKPLANNTISISASGTSASISLYASGASASIYLSTNGNYGGIYASASGTMPKIQLVTNGNYGSIYISTSGSYGTVSISASNFYLSNSIPFQRIGTKNYPILHGYDHHFTCYTLSPGGIDCWFAAEFLANDSRWFSAISDFAYMLYRNGYTTSSTPFTNVRGYYGSWLIGGMWIETSDVTPPENINLICYYGGGLNYSQHLFSAAVHGYYVYDYPRNVNTGYNY